MRVAAAQYPIEALANWTAFEAKLEAWVARAEGADLLVFPEYGAMELESLLPAGERSLGALQRFAGPYVELHARLAAAFGVHILASSFPTAVGAEFRNRAWLLAPDGGRAFQEKLHMTRFEAESWGVSPGEDLAVLDTAIGRTGIAICYDAEFPLTVRALVEAGAEVILVPSCTDTDAGHHRVRIACAARALENQCFVVRAPTVGEAPWSEAVDVNVGTAAVHGPVDRGFPSDGVLAEGARERPGWVTADLDLAALQRVRVEGQVLNHRDWVGQARATARPVRRIGLRACL